MGMQGKKERHRLFLDVPAADVRPPEGIAEISLHTVRLCMDILETSPRRRSTTKRSNSPRSERRASALDEEDSDTLLHEMASEDLLHDIDTDRSQTAVRALACRKRKRSATETMVSTQSHSPDKAKKLKRPRKRLIVDSSMQRKSRPDFTSSDRINVASMDNRPRELCNDVSPPAGYAQMNQQHGRSIGSPHLDIDVRESEDDLLLDSYPQNTMANTSCSADRHFQTPDSLDDDLF
ncbi:unnamed protein product [Alternaria alternata]